MRRLKILILLGLCFFLTGCLARSPEIAFVSSEAKLLDARTVSAKFNFSLRNPNNVPLNGKIDYALFIAEREFFSGQSEQIEAPAGGGVVFALAQNIELEKIFGSATELFNAIMQGQQSVKIRVAGQCAAKILFVLDFPVKFDQTIEVPLPDRARLEKQLRDQAADSLLDSLKSLF
ncbi:MAG: LEA type 2 family protein [Candidatus Margulisbacteria bacterium]|jgi:hypothetical protein|nr:LEA type 2 family protein [Candidatus Margulisiibacteriota bacterium]